MWIRVRLFFWFLRQCLKYPLTIRENWQDMNNKYYWQTDEEAKKIFEELNKRSNDENT